MSVFDLNEQNKDLDHKIAAGLERLSQVFRTLLWEQAKEQLLSPLQIQLLIFIRYHSADKAGISYLAREFQVTKPTVSDAVKVLEQKKLVQKISHPSDSRRYTLALTTAGKELVEKTENFASPFTEVLSGGDHRNKELLWEQICRFILQLHQKGMISVQRTCYRCRHFSRPGPVPFCNLLQQPLRTKDIRIDCYEYESAEQV